MPTSRKIASDWFITLSTATAEEVDIKQVLNYCETKCLEYHVVEEHGKNGSHVHYHAFIRYASDKSQDNVRKTFRRFVKDADEKPRCVVVKYAFDPQGLIYEYMEKEGECVVLSSNHKVVADGFSRGKKKPEPRKNKLVTIVAAPDLIRKFCVETEYEFCDPHLQMPTLERFNEIIRRMIRSGYNFLTVWKRLGDIFHQMAIEHGSNVDPVGRLWSDHQ